MTHLDVPNRPTWWERVAPLPGRAVRGIRWYVTTLMGDRAYETYLVHERAHHPGCVPLTERQYWRERMDEQDRNPGARCC